MSKVKLGNRVRLTRIKASKFLYSVPLNKMNPNDSKFCLLGQVVDFDGWGKARVYFKEIDEAFYLDPESLEVTDED